MTAPASTARFLSDPRRSQDAIPSGYELDRWIWQRAMDGEGLLAKTIANVASSGSTPRGLLRMAVWRIPVVQRWVRERDLAKARSSIRASMDDLIPLFEEYSVDPQTRPDLYRDIECIAAYAAWQPFEDDARKLLGHPDKDDDLASSLRSMLDEVDCEMRGAQSKASLRATLESEALAAMVQRCTSAGSTDEMIEAIRGALEQVRIVEVRDALHETLERLHKNR